MFLHENSLTRALSKRTELSRWPGLFSPSGIPSLVYRPVPWLAAGGLVSCTLGLWIGFFLVPLDPRQGEIHRILYIHVPASWMSLIIYLLITLWVCVELFFNARLAAMMTEALAPTGALFAFLTLWTGSLWGKPLWGAWWVWDMRLAADLGLLCLYLVIVALHAGIEDGRRAGRIVAGLVLVSAVVVPATLSTLVLWPALHANPLVRLPESAGSAAGMLAALMAVTAGFSMHGSAIVLMRLRCVIPERERQRDWAALRARDAG